MCGRYTLKENKEQVAGWLDAVMEGFEDYEPNYNVAPSSEMPVMVDDKSRQRLLYPFRWGLLPFWAEEEKVSYSMINARAESLADKKSFKPCFESQRCIVPASGFYEWKGEKGNKTPYYIYPTHESLSPSRDSTTSGTPPTAPPVSPPDLEWRNRYIIP